MARDGGPDWNGLFKWSIAHGDGTKPPRALSEEDRKWLEAMQANTIDVVKRMKEITRVMITPEDVLQSQGVTPENTEDMLDELQGHVESLDMANGSLAFHRGRCRWRFSTHGGKAAWGREGGADRQPRRGR